MSRTVVITGASAGIGRATAHAFAREGARIGLIARDATALAAAVEEVRRLGGEAVALPLDVADARAVDEAADDVERRLGPIDVWVNDAMTTIFAPIAQITPEEFRRATEVTYLGFVYGTMAALKRMRRRDRGTIIQVGSALAYRAIPLQAPYCGAKFAIRGFTDSLRTELLHDGSRVHVTMVQMPAVNTPQFDWARNRMPRRPQPVPPIYQPEVAAEAIVFASRARRREVWVGGSTWAAILGNRLAPGWLDHILARKGYTAQISEAPRLRQAPDNLFHPVTVEHATHGRFDRRARRRSYALTAAEHPWVALAAGLGAGALVAALGIWATRGAAPEARRVLQRGAREIPEAAQRVI